METTPGVVVGTAGYMSPEQVRGDSIDYRSDIFSFGAILYEMITGRFAFRRRTYADTIGAVLREDPPTLGMPPLLDRVVRHCLEKSPDSRFQSTKDIGFDLAAVLDTSSAISTVQAQIDQSRALRWKRFATWGAVVAALLALAAAYWIGTLRPKTATPDFHQLTFQQGTIDSAVYAPGGDTVLFAASWNGAPGEVYSARVDSPTGVRALGVVADRVLAVSKRGDLALLQGLQGSPIGGTGTLAQMPLGGGAARPTLTGVLAADWSPITDDLALSRLAEGQFRLEYPPGKVLRQTSGYIDAVRFSPDGKRIAFLEHPNRSDNAGFVAVTDLAAHVRVLTQHLSGIEFLAWTPSGQELWFTTGDFATQTSVMAVSLNGQQRHLASVPGNLLIQSVLPNGRALAIHRVARHMLMVHTAEQRGERDLAWLDWPARPQFSDDGKKIAFDEQSSATRGTWSVYLRSVEGGPGVRVGSGWDPRISPDGKWILAGSPPQPTQLILYPTGPGEPVRLTHSALAFGAADWFPDSKRIAAIGYEKDSARTYLIDLQGSVIPLTPPGVHGYLTTHDGRSVLVRYPDHTIRLFPVDGTAPRLIHGMAESDSEVRFSNDGKYLFVSTTESPIQLKVWRIELANGKRQLYNEIRPPDPAGVSYTAQFALGPDLRSYAYVYARRLSSLYEIEGVR